MAIVSVNLRHDKDASQEIGRKAYVEVYIVEVDSVTQDPVSIRDATGVPAFGDTHPFDSAARVKKKKIRSFKESRKVFEVIVNYTTDVSSTSPSGDDANDPLEETPRISWDVIEIEAPITQDIDGAPIDNSAGDVFDPAPTEIRVEYECIITRNEATYDPVVAADFINTTNSKGVDTVPPAPPIAGFPLRIGQARLAQYSALTQERNNQQFFAVTYRLLIKTLLDEDIDDLAILWDLVIQDRGFNKLVAGKKTIIIDDGGKGARKPVKLDGSGARLPEGDPAKYRRFVTLRKSDFTDLDLPAETLP